MAIEGTAVVSSKEMMGNVHNGRFLRQFKAAFDCVLEHLSMVCADEVIERNPCLWISTADLYKIASIGHLIL